MGNCKDHKTGDAGKCICIKCNTTVLHIPGTPCKKTLCPKCDAKMLRENSEHHLAFLKKKGGL
jgi:hypothetical protein